MANENLKKFLDSAGVGYLWTKVTEKVAEEVKVEADRAKAAEQEIVNKIGDLGDNATVVAYVDKKTEGIASSEVVQGLSDRVGVIEGDYVKSADIADFETKENVKKVSDDLGVVAGKVDTLIGDDANKSVRTIANEELAAQLIGENAQESLDTLAEIAAWIQDHPGDAAAMNAAITALQAKVVLGTDAEGNEYATVKAYVEAAIAALEIGDYATAADLAALAGRVTTLEGKVDVDKVSTAIATAKSGAVDEAKAYADGLNNAMDARVDKLEAIDHDAYKAADEANLTAAKTYADGLNGAMDTRVKALEGVNHDAYIAADEANLTAAKAYTDEVFATIQALTNAEIDTAIGNTVTA